MYQRNILGEIYGIIDLNGKEFINYTYNAYGVPSITLGTNLNPSEMIIASDLAQLNIYLYKGYIYDQEVGRWLSIDHIAYLDSESIGGLNLYEYCGNNPVMYLDPSGHFFISFLVASMIVGAVIGGTVSGYNAYQSGERGWDLVFDIAGGAIMGSAVGAALALGGAAGLAATGATVAGFGLSTAAAFGIA